MLSLNQTILTTTILLIAARGFANEYPESQRGPVVESFETSSGNVSVEAPYRWLEEKVTVEGKTTWSQPVQDWIEQQEKFTNVYFSMTNERKSLKTSLRKFAERMKVGTPIIGKNRILVPIQKPSDVQPVVYELIDCKPVSTACEKLEVLNPVKLSEDGSVSIANMSLSPDGRYLAYGLSVGGSDWNEFKVFDLDSRKTLSDSVKWSKFFSVEWAEDSSGFFYSRYPEVEDLLSAKTENHKVYFHRLGESQSSDKLVFADETQKQLMNTFSRSSDGLQILTSYDFTSAERYAKNLVKIRYDSGHWNSLIDDWLGEFKFLGASKGKLLFRTNYESPNWKIVSIDPKNAAPSHWEDVVNMDQNKNLINAVKVEDNLVLHYLSDVKAQLVVFSLETRSVRAVELPSIGSVMSMAKMDEGSKELIYNFSSFTTPVSPYFLNLENLESRPLVSDASTLKGMAVKQIKYRSKDGTHIPMFIVNRKGRAKDSTQKVLLYGYGGFNVSLTPRFMVDWAAWLENGGTLAIANIRGGGEYGVAWHRAGKLEKKQNVFDDFAYAAKHLIAEGYTTPSRLAVSGRSNGGLLVGVIVQQYPELFAAGLASVGVLDMLRYQKFSGGSYWMGEYGDPQNPQHFDYLYKYSPLHNAKRGQSYPAVFVSTGEYDNRVDPSHSFKYAAAMQYAQAGDAPILLRVYRNSGHGAGRSTDALVKEYVEKLGFLLDQMDP